jgi:bifunctional UDP-N-acetylglucosamine pyrophosphorylase/glucosamine-1-phosphate N-acetyltransferase
MRQAGREIGAHVATDWAVTLGINDRVDLARVRAIAQERINEAHMLAGVTLIDPRTATIDVGVTIGADTVIEPSCVIRGATAIGEHATIGPFTTLIDAEVGDGATVLRAHLHRARVGAKAIVGPIAYLRPDAVLAERAKAGTFVEIKNSNIGERTKVPHLTYLGDADVGADTNIAAGNITANQEHTRVKERTTIGSNVRTGVDNAFVAPVSIGDDAWIAAGSVITEDVPPGALAIARAKQVTKEGRGGKRND